MQLLKLLKIRLKVGGDRVKDSITDIATSVKSGDIALTIKFPLPNQVEFNIEVMSKDLLPTSEELDEYITVIVKHLITFYDNTVKEPVISEDGLIFGVAVIGVIAICIFFPESILSIPELLGGVGILSAV